MPGGCWWWQGGRDKDGYGMVWVDEANRARRAHRLLWAEFNGDPGEMMVLHKCNNPSCVNPDHLYRGNNSDNQRDAVVAKHQINSKKTHCPRGHVLDGHYTLSTGEKKRYCKTCDRANYGRPSRRRDGRAN